MRFRPALVVALLVLVASGAMVTADPSSSGVPGVIESERTTSVGVVDSSNATGSGVDDPPNTTSTEFERADPGLVVTVQLRSNGNARWHVTHRYVVNGSNETTAFREFASSVSAGERDVGVEKATFERFAAAASDATGREMQIRNAGWSGSRIENETGELTYSFTWTNFGQVQGEQIIVGDAFRSPGGTWFPRLYDGQRLVIRPPPALNIVQTPPDKGLNQRALVWDGYREFEPGYLSVVLERPSDTTTVTTTPGTTATNATTTGVGDPDEGLSPFLLGVGFALLLVFVGAGSYFFARWQTLQGTNGDDDDGSPAVTEASDGGSPPDSGAATTASDAGESAARDAVESGGTPDREQSGGAEPAAVEGAAAGAVADGDDDEPEIDEALLSDEERVLRLLERNGGRMKQANIVTETGWSNAKVSQLLSGMDEDDEIQKLRIGRENLITLPDENVADFGDEE